MKRRKNIILVNYDLKSLIVYSPDWKLIKPSMRDYAIVVKYYFIYYLPSRFLNSRFFNAASSSERVPALLRRSLTRFRNWVQESFEIFHEYKPSDDLLE